MTGGMTIERVMDSVPRGTGVLDVLRDVLGAGTFPGGPRLVLDPDSVTTDRFVDWYRPCRRPADRVCSVVGRHDAAQLRDVLGDPIPGAPALHSASVFFIDREPAANWAHECWYVFVGPDDIVRCVSNMPPDSSLECVPLCRGS